MPRKQRFYLGGVPALVTHYGNNRQPIFLNPEDYSIFLAHLLDATTTRKCFVHAYVFMRDHFHVLLTPPDSTAVSKTIQELGRRYVAYFNRRYNRSGTLWEGRHRGSVVDGARYALSCAIYVERNPVRSGIVRCPAAWQWSSYAWNAHGEGAELAPLPQYTALGDSPQSCRDAYRELHRQVSADDDAEAITRSVRSGMLIGDEHFKKRIECRLGRKVGHGRRGRPPASV